jgi:predicted Zn-dependent peptidase
VPNKKITLPNGVRIVSEPLSHVKSVSLGIWFANGSRHEARSEYGFAHFLEHMCFKGTHSRSATDIANEIDDLGGNINAFTSKDQTCFHAKVLDEHLPHLIALLSDMVINSQLLRSDIVNERKVILDEIDMYEDSTEEVANERLFSSIYAKSNLAHPVLGTKTEVNGVGQAALNRYHQSRFTGGNIVIAIAGSFKKRDLTQLSEAFGTIPGGANVTPEIPRFTPCVKVKRKPGEQNHIAFGNPGVSLVNGERFTFRLLASILGGGMSSRLFQRLREDLGLCYSIYSYLSAMADCGFIGTSVALSPDSEEKALAAYRDEISRLLDDGVTAVELERAKIQYKSSILMSLEATNNHMQLIAGSELVHGTETSVEETIASYLAVSEADVLSAIRKAYGTGSTALSAVGDVHTESWYRKRLGN